MTCTALLLGLQYWVAVPLSLTVVHVSVLSCAVLSLACLCLSHTHTFVVDQVHLPHDGLIAAKPSEKACPSGCSGKSFIPRHPLWYRKKFNVPSAWQGSAYWIDFQGSFRNTTIWINGQLITSHECGYTPFRVRLDNVSAVKVGEENVLAVFVDPDNGDEGECDEVMNDK